MNNTKATTSIFAIAVVVFRIATLVVGGIVVTITTRGEHLHTMRMAKMVPLPQLPFFQDNQDHREKKVIQEIQDAARTNRRYRTSRTNRKEYRTSRTNQTGGWTGKKTTGGDIGPAGPKQEATGPAGDRGTSRT